MLSQTNFDHALTPELRAQAIQLQQSAHQWVILGYIVKHLLKSALCEGIDSVVLDVYIANTGGGT